MGQLTRIIGPIGAILTAAILCSPPYLVAQSPAARTMAVTFDDLPYVAVGSTDYLHDAQRATADILRVLAAHHVPVVAFVNEGKLDARGETDARIALLQRWVDAGAILGNHTYSHRELNAATIEQFEDEIVRGWVVTPRLMASRQPYTLYFRHPETHTGNTAEKKQAIDAFLAARGYTIAPHTVENADFMFNVPYVRARRAGDAALRERLMQAYLDHSFAALQFAEDITPKVFERDIPQTFLIHANDITADALDTILSRLESRGYRFITLDEAMRDPAYQTRNTLVTKGGPTWLWRWMKSKGMSVSFAADPEPPDWVTALYAAR